MGQISICLTAIFIFIMGISPLWANSFGYQNTALGFGSHTRHVNTIQKNLAGDRNKFEFRPYLTLNVHYALSENWGFYPELGLIFPHSTPDDTATIYEYFGLATLGYKLKDFTFKAGTGFAMTTISSDGGTKTLRNGASTTDFPVANGSSTARNIVIDLSAGYHILPSLSTRLQGLIYNPETNLNRSWSYVLSFYYHFDPFTKTPAPAPAQVPVQARPAPTL